MMSSRDERSEHHTVGTSSQHSGSTQDNMLEGYPVYPKTDCPHIRVLPQYDIPTKLDITAACVVCQSKQENWLCLTCYSVHCSRFVNEHMMRHSAESQHLLALSFSDISVWCYGCNAYIDDKKLYVVKNAVHMEKFGSEMPMYYASPDQTIQQV